MSRRWRYLGAALLALVAAVITWRIFVAHPPQRAEAQRTLAGDAAVFASSRGNWQSDVLKLKMRDGSVVEEILVIEFGPSAHAGQSNGPIAQAKLYLATPTQGIKGVAESSSTLGDGSFRNVRLQEKDGVRSMTITSDKLEKGDPKKTQREIERYKKLGGYWAITFPYELKNNRLTLKSFPTTNKVGWGVTEFIVPQAEITFKAVP